MSSKIYMHMEWGMALKAVIIIHMFTAAGLSKANTFEDGCELKQSMTAWVPSASNLQDTLLPDQTSSQSDSPSDS